MNKIAFVLPIYTPHIAFWKAFLKSFQKYQMNKQCDLFFVFTNKIESNIFWSYKNKIILPNDIEKAFYRGSTHFPDAKKIYACNILKNKYEYIITLDAESEIIKNVDIFQMCEKYYKDKILYGNKCNPWNIVIKNSLERFTNDEKTNQNLELYLWFNQPCIYKTEYLDDFFDKTGILKNIDKLKFWSWEYYAFMLYLIFYHNFKVVDIEARTEFSFCETPSEEFLYHINDYNHINDCNFLISTEYIYNTFIKWTKNDNIFMLIQLNTKRDVISRSKNLIRYIYNIIRKIFHWIGIS